MYFVVCGFSTRGFPYGPVNIIVGVKNIIIIRNIEITSNI